MIYNLRELKIELTYKCILSCIHCSSDGHYENDVHIEISECSRIINEAISMGVEKIIFSGGEPLLWGGLSQMIHQCSQNNIKTEIFSSGYIDNFEITIDNLKSNGLDRITFSLYGASPHTHEGITRISGSFDRTIQAINYAIKSKLETHIHFLAFSINYNEISPVYILAKELGISTISVLRFVPQGRGSLLKDYALTIKQSKELKELILNLRQDGRVPIRTGSPWNYLFINANPKCMAGIDRLTIKPNLHIAPCDAFKNIEDIDLLGKKNRLSTIYRNSLSNCWYESSYLNNIREIIRKNTICVDCSCYNICNGGCAAQKFIETGNFNGPDPSCLLKG